ncbi:MAG: hypothetical protein AAF399_09960 [Bacteroidota bacterium]
MKALFLVLLVFWLGGLSLTAQVEGPIEISPYSVDVVTDPAQAGMTVNEGPRRYIHIKSEKWQERMDNIVRSYTSATESYDLELTYQYVVNPKGKVKSVKISEKQDQISAEDLTQMLKYGRKIRFYAIDDWEKEQIVTVVSRLAIDYREP